MGEPNIAAGDWILVCDGKGDHRGENAGDRKFQTAGESGSRLRRNDPQPGPCRPLKRVFKLSPKNWTVRNWRLPSAAPPAAADSMRFNLPSNFEPRLKLYALDESTCTRLRGLWPLIAPALTGG